MGGAGVREIGGVGGGRLGEELGGGGLFGEVAVEGPQRLGLIEGGVDGEATIVEGEVGIIEIERENLREQGKICIDIERFEKLS